MSLGYRDAPAVLFKKDWRSAMKLDIDISKDIFAQFSAQLACTVQGNMLELSPDLGNGLLRSTYLPGAIELHYFNFILNTPVELHSFNSPDSEWLLLNTNLSTTRIDKTVNQQPLSVHRFLPTGILFYAPGTRVKSVGPVGKKLEIALIRFKRGFLQQYATNAGFLNVEPAVNALIYEDLDYNLENILQRAIHSQDAMIKHAKIIEYVGNFIQKIINRERDGRFDSLSPSDVQGLFVAAAHLRNPVQDALPSIEALATIAGMSATKFKNTFKQVFGTPPIRYHTKIKLEYARNELLAGDKTPSELSYELGYSHPSKFSRAFKKFFHVSPSDL